MSKLLNTDPRMDIYKRVADAIIRDLEQGTRSWIKPWTTAPASVGTIRPLRHDGTPYRGVNVLILWSEATDRGYTSPTWMTYRQALALGGQVRKGEHGTTIVYATTIERTEDDPATGEEVIERIPLLRAYSVFNVDQIDGLDTPSPAQPAIIAEPAAARIDRADAFMGATGATVAHKGSRACYIPSRDLIEMPPYRQFIDTPTSSAAEGYYATLLHELVHYADLRIMPRRCSFPRGGVQIRRDLSA
jgi:antirestriction protein ArdC